ncbi:ABC transporter, permease protein [Campylobacter mucosalis]|uniref:FecCD family ABC transporter permease n=1 Tax=Campylobacter mucosalis TaxID=202 RepID=UPI0005586DF4|nr:iron ABC transporter permease [Campylobacter mucosalis]QKF63518.1 ABC transporter, permease protein [Campylobacter mucosalis]
MFKFFILLGFWLILCLISLGVGSYHLSPSEVLDTLLFATNERAKDVIFGIRVPRILLSSICGAMLAVSGASLQAVFKNPLVGPNIIGVSSAAAFGGAIAILLGFGGIALIFCAFFMGIFAIILLGYIAKFVRQSSIFSLILSGVVVNGFFGALISLTQYLADNEQTLPNIIFWLLGSFISANYDKFFILFFISLICGGTLMVIRWRLNLLSLSDDDIIGLGINPKTLRIIILLCTTLLISAQVAMSGNIGWIGLVVPHMARFLVGQNYNINLPVCAILGAVFMLLIDTISRASVGSEIPLGILTALIGTPVFVYLLRVCYGKI